MFFRNLAKITALCFFALHANFSLGGELYIEKVTPSISASMYKTPFVEDATGQDKRDFELNGRLRSYQLYDPGPSDLPRAVVVLLHGAGRTGASVVEMWKPIADANGLLLIGPNSLGESWNPQTDGSTFLAAVLNDASRRYRLDRRRIYLFGHSAGAVLALYLSIAHSDFFAATAVHAGKFFSPEHYARIDKAKRRIPMVFINGTHDHLFPIAEVTESAKAFADRQHETKLYVLDGHTHWYYDIAPLINELAWRHLSQYTLQATP